MEKNPYLNFLEKASYIEGILRASKANRDIFPLQVMLVDDDLRELVYKHFHFSDTDDFLAAFTRNDDYFYQTLEEKFAGYKILFHARKIRSEHTVPNTHMLYCVRGECFLYVNGHEVRLKEGGTCIIAPDVPTSYCNMSESTLVIHVALTAAFISASLLPRLPQEYTLNHFFRSIIFNEEKKTPYLYVPAHTEHCEEMSYMLSAAFYHNTYKPPMWEEMVNSYVILFFCYMLSSEQPLLTTAPISDVGSNTLTQMQDYLTHNVRNITLHQLAEVFHFNESYLSQYLKKNTGENFTSLLQNARIAQAEKLLVNTSMSIVEIADQVGYQNVSYFYKIFFKVNKCSPTEYRNQYAASRHRVIGHESLT